MTSYKLFSIILLFVCISCKDNKQQSNETSNTESETSTEEIKLPPAAMNKPDAKFIEAAGKQKINNEITDQIWHYAFALSIKDPTPKENVYEGQWLDLLSNGTFKQGLYQDTLDSGYYLFTESEKEDVLELRSEKAASEWKVKKDPANLLLVGTSKYGNNPWQIKLRRSASLPEKK
ncbi:MAG: hypothetical protein IPM92_06420 [Saprospiraceae bacterium]|nr:hypothetical protein [Saprospiraceae bacterium]